MKKTVLICAAVLCLAMGLASCASVAGKPMQATELLDWKGAALGQKVPAWVIAANESVEAIQSLPDYQGQYCFAVTLDNASKDFAVSWVTNPANASAEVSRMIANTVNAEAETQAKSAGQDINRGLSELNTEMSNASFKNLRKSADFWILSKNKATAEEYYTAYSLWTIPQTDLNDQIAANYQNIIDNNKAMSEAERSIYLDIIKNIRERGMTTVSSQSQPETEVAEQ
ncbi:MAG: hypothetical protein LBM77_04705 [Spirochaetaceae bacterium]|nr:hypothetical protein [Spirochaetaceae bacterium]